MKRAYKNKNNILYFRILNGSTHFQNKIGIYPEANAQIKTRNCNVIHVKSNEETTPNSVYFNGKQFS